MKLSIVIIDTNELHLLRSCLRAVYDQTRGMDFEVIVVDNACTDGSHETVAPEFPLVKWVTNSKKMGFAAANNVAFPFAVGEYILLLNPDTEVLDGAIQKTIAFADTHPAAGVVGSRLLYPDGSVQPSVRGFPSVLGAFLDATFLHVLLPSDRIVRRSGIVRFDPERTQEVDWVIGAYFLIRRTVMEKIGTLDEQFWIYGEEVDFCQRARTAGYATWYVAEASVVHYWRGMTVVTLRVIVWLHFGQKLYVDKQYRGLEKFVIIYLRYLGAALRVVVYPVVGLILFRKSFFLKAYYYAIALWKLCTQKWRYDFDHTGEVVPWTEYL